MTLRTFELRRACSHAVLDGTATTDSINTYLGRWGMLPLDGTETAEAERLLIHYQDIHAEHLAEREVLMPFTTNRNVANSCEPKPDAIRAVLSPEKPPRIASVGRSPARWTSNTRRTQDGQLTLF